MLNYLLKYQGCEVNAMPNRDTLQIKAEKALKEAVREVIEDHKRTGRPLIIWRNGKVAKVSAKRLSRKGG